MADQEELVWNGSDELARSSAHAEVDFVVRNRGQMPIRVLEAVSGCGCATPKVEPSTIPPGGSGTVHVEAIPLAVGEKVVPITLKTDSPLTANVALRVRIIGNRRPPFLLQVFGDLNFNGYASQAETRDVTALTIEPKGPARPPMVRSDLPFVTFDEPVMTEKPICRPRPGRTALSLSGFLRDAVRSGAVPGGDEIHRPLG